MELESHGIVPPHYFEDPINMTRSQKLQHEMLSIKVKELISQRCSPTELESRGIIVPQCYEDDPECMHKRVSSLHHDTSEVLTRLLSKRKNVHNLVEHNVLPSEYIEKENYDDASWLKFKHQLDVCNELEEKLTRRKSLDDLHKMKYL